MRDQSEAAAVFLIRLSEESPVCHVSTLARTGPGRERSRRMGVEKLRQETAGLFASRRGRAIERDPELNTSRPGAARLSNLTYVTNITDRGTAVNHRWEK
jgi:hypothetical protein